MTADELRRAVGRRLREARVAAGLSREELGEKLNVHTGSIARWETGGSMPQPYLLERISEITGTPASWLQFGDSRPAAKTAGARRRSRKENGTAQYVFSSFDSVVRFLGGIGAPGEQRLRKLDALEGYRRMITASGALPDWWYQLRARVERGEL